MTARSVSIKQALEALSPNRQIALRIYVGYAVASVAVFAVAWQLGAGVLPSPREVGAALVRLWTEHGLFDALATSLLLNAEAIAWSARRTLGMTEWRAVWEVVVLGTADRALEALRQSAAMGWMMLTMVEGIVRSEGGIGAMMLNENKHLQLDAVFALIVVVLLVGVAQDL